MIQTAPDGGERGIDEGALEACVRDEIPAALADLARLVRIPSVSWPAFDPEPVQRSAEAVAALVRGLDVFETVEIVREATEDGRPGGPAVLARRPPAEGMPTVLLYAHHDVQPPGDPEAWDSEAYEPTVRGDRLYGRGAADDKAGVLSHVAAIRALARALGERGPRLGLALFIEGEEEFGSPSFGEILRRHRETLAADAIIVADSADWDVETPSLTASLRGNVTFRLVVETLAHPLHSGIFGGAVPDAMMAATRLLASLHAEDGSVAVEGLHEHRIQTPDYPEARLREETGLPDGVEPIGHGSILSRLWAQPSITVTGIDAPSVATASNTLAASVAARVSVRVAPGQTADEALAAIERHLRENTPFGARVRLEEVETGSPFLVDTDGPLAAALRDAMESGWGRPAVEAGMGGSIPFVPDLARVFPEAEILITGIEDPDTRAHSPNESLHLGVFARATLTEALFLARIDAGLVGGAPKR